MRIVLTGGGSMGHLMPLEPIIDTLRTAHNEKKKELPGWIEVNRLDVYFMGVADERVRAFFKRLDVRVIDVPAGKLRRYPSPRTISDILFRIPLGTVVALWHMWRIMPEVVVSKGGYGSVPVTLAAVFYRIPIMLHESDVVGGLANRMMSSLASVITVGFAKTRQEMTNYKSKTIVTGTPVRTELARFDPVEAKKMFGLEGAKKVILVVGGSQGARQINDVLLQALPNLIKEVSIIHVTGNDHLRAVKKSVNNMMARSGLRSQYKAFGYLSEQMGQALAAADIVVARAGATTLAELAMLKKAAIIIPLDGSAQDHQRQNATIFGVAGAARVIDPANLGRSLFEQNVKSLLDNEKVCQTLRENIAHFEYPQASRDIVNLIYKLAMGLVPRQK